MLIMMRFRFVVKFLAPSLNKCT
uniref:Uncharacterized protein n=1 Tax=Rhizophora mucronata TaxID=61149 RepID=A0A2P2QIM9_RHIMU